MSDLETLLNKTTFSDEELATLIERLRNTIKDMNDYGSMFRVNANYLHITLQGLIVIARARNWKDV